MSSGLVNGDHHTEAVLLPPSSKLSQLSLAPTQDVTKAGNERTLALKTLLDKGHITVAPLRDPQLILHSHLPHVSLRRLRSSNTRKTDQLLVAGICFWLGGEPRTDG